MGGNEPTSASSRDIKRWREHLASERDAALVYENLAATESGERAEVLRELAEIERKHAAHWEERLREAGEKVPPAPQTPSLRGRALGLAARQLSVDAVLPMLERAERSASGTYDNEPFAAPGMADDERGHAKALAALRDPSVERIGHREPWHRGDRSGALRAGIFGVSDGLVSNTALVMGFAGSGAARSAVLLAGVAGLIAGSFSMAAGEFVSMSGQREMFEREISLERQELEEKPAEERQELVLLYRAKGLTREQAAEVADQIMQDRAVALDTLVREELGLDPDELGSPWQAAASSLLAFALGALVVVLPYLVTGGTGAFLAAVLLALAAMAAVGAGIGVLNGRSALRGAFRQVAAGALAAGVTYLVGHLIGTQVG